MGADLLCIGRYYDTMRHASALALRYRLLVHRIVSLYLLLQLAGKSKPDIRSLANIEGATETGIPADRFDGLAGRNGRKS